MTKRIYVIEVFSKVLKEWAPSISAKNEEFTSKRKAELRADDLHKESAFALEYRAVEKAQGENNVI